MFETFAEFFPVLDGAVTGVTVLARGEVRPDVGTLYFPVSPVDGVSLIPEAQWNLFSRAPEAGAQPNRELFPTGEENSQNGGQASGCAPEAGAQPNCGALPNCAESLMGEENSQNGRPGVR